MVLKFTESKDKLLNNISRAELTIEEVLTGNGFNQHKEESEDAPDRFNTVVNFPNFLLHVLRVQTGDENVALDDKRLIEIFDSAIADGKDTGIDFAKKFIYNLLKCKFLFDKYIIKREFTANTDRWSLKTLKRYTKNNASYINTFPDTNSDEFIGDNRRVLMLLAMFHVSLPSMSYKYWLSAALKFLFDGGCSSREYIVYLEHIAKSFVFDQFIAQKPIGYREIIWNKERDVQRSGGAIDWNKLRYDKLENNLIFNFTDYLLWLKKKSTGQRIKEFEFTFRSSVEHYYPQTPVAGIAAMDSKHLHSFGNLCLISHEKNSRLSNLLPAAKKDYYIKSVTIDSIKQLMMMDYPEWGINTVESHEKEMIEMLSFCLDSNGSPIAFD